MIQTEYRSGKGKDWAGDVQTARWKPPSSAAAGYVTSLGMGVSCHNAVTKRQDVAKQREYERGGEPPREAGALSRETCAAES